MPTKIQKNQIATTLLDGWTPADATWTYNAVDKVNVPSGAASLYQKGDRIKFTQTTVKYFVVTAVADTLLTFAVNTDYTVANAAISANHYSHQANPLGYPTRFAYTSVTNGATGTIGTFAESMYSSYFSIVGTQCFLELYKDVTNKGSWSSTFQFTLPVIPASSPSYNTMYGNLVATTGSTTFWTVAQVVGGSTTASFDKNGTGYVTWADLTATFRLSCNGFYFI